MWDSSREGRFGRNRSHFSVANQLQRWGSVSNGGDAFASQNSANMGAGDSSRTNLIVNYLPQSMTEANLYSMFSTIGPIQSCKIMKDCKTGYSYGFGFVNYVHDMDAARAVEAFNGYRLKNKMLKVSFARPSGDDIKDTNLYVTNLPRGITDEELDTIFGRYGRIVQKHVLRDKKSGAPRGVAFVRFDRREQAQEAIAALNNVIPEGGTEPLRVKVAEEHGKQKAAYYAGWAAGYNYNYRDDYSWSCNGPVADVRERFPPMRMEGRRQKPEPFIKTSCAQQQIPPWKRFPQPMNRPWLPSFDGRCNGDWYRNRCW